MFGGFESYIPLYLKDTDYTVSNGTSLKDGSAEFVLSDSNGNLTGVIDMFVDKVFIIVNLNTI